MRAKGKDKPLLLIVGDDVSRCYVVSDHARSIGYDVVLSEASDLAFFSIRNSRPDIIVFDLHQTDSPSLGYLSRIKDSEVSSPTPIIVLYSGAMSDSFNQVLSSLNFIPLPWSSWPDGALKDLSLLFNRILQVDQVECLRYGDILVDLDAYRVFQANREIFLGPVEYRLIVALMERPGLVWSRESLLRRVWKQNLAATTRTVDVHIWRLRKHLKSSGSDDPIQTIRGVGYVLR